MAAKISKGSGEHCDESLEHELEAFAMVAKVKRKVLMSGVMLIVGVVCACGSLVALVGGLIMLWLGLWVEKPQDDQKDCAFALFITAGCFYLGVAAILGFWVPAVCWIFLSPMILMSAFLSAIILALGDEKEEACG